MSKTAEQWVEEAIACEGRGELDKAIEGLNKAIEVDPNFGRSYFRKAFVMEKQGCTPQAQVEYYKKAIEKGFTHPQVYHNAAIMFMLSNQLEESAIHFRKAYEADKNKTDAIAFTGKVLECLGRKDEAMKCYDQCIADHPQAQTIHIFKSLYFKSCLLSEMGRHEEALPLFKRVNDEVYNPGCVYHHGQALLALGRRDEAMKLFEAGADIADADAPDVFINVYRGQCKMALGKKDAAMEDFKEGQKILAKGQRTVHPPDIMNGIKDILEHVFEAEGVAKEVETAVNNLDPKSEITKRFTTNMKKLVEEKNKAQAKVLQNLDKVPTAENKDALIELSRIKEEFAKQLAQLQNQVNRVEDSVVKVDKRVSAVEHNLDELKEEVNNKMDDWNKKLDSELKKQDLSADDQAKLKGYFKAFVETFSSIHVTSQVMDSGQVKLDADSNVASALSFIASFAPFVGSGLSSGVKSLGEFLKSKEMKTNARKMKRLASDATQLSQVIGKTGYEILINKDKQKKILNITVEDSHALSQDVFSKLVRLCKDLDDEIDVYLYGDLYKTPTEKAGHSDANELIEKWINGDILPDNIEMQFVKKILNPTPKEGRKDAVVVEGRSACCNVF